MGKIVKRLVLMGERGRARAAVLLDSGAGSSLIRRDVADKIIAHFTPLDPPVTFKGVNGKKAFTCNLTCIPRIKMKGKVLHGDFCVVRKMPREVIIGVDFLQQWEISLYPKRHDYAVGLDPQAIELAGV